MRRWLVPLLLLWPVLAAARAQTATHQVAVRHNSFQPSTVTAAPHDTITWTNHDDVAHTVTFEGTDPDPLPPGESHSDSFATPGTYRYRCDLHQAMTGSVVVQASSASTTSPSTSSTTSTTLRRTSSTTTTTVASAVTAPPSTSTSSTTTTTIPFTENSTTTVVDPTPAATGSTGTRTADGDDVDVPGGIAAVLLLVTAAAALAQTRGGLG